MWCCSIAADVNIWQQISFGQCMCTTVGDVSLIKENNIGERDVRFFLPEKSNYSNNPCVGLFEHSYTVT